MSRPRHHRRDGGNPGSSSAESQHNVALSKALSWLLRHNAVKEGLQLHSGGYVNVEDVLKHSRFSRYKVEDIRAVVAANDKQRFSLREEGETLQIRANQGHSIQVEDSELLEPLLTTDANFPTTVIHGTYTRFWDSIRRQGLSRMNRNHIHFAVGEPGNTQVISGMRQSAEIYIYVDIIKAIEDGLKFYRSENNVILSSGNSDGFLVSKYFSKVVDVKRNQILLTNAVT